MRGIFKERFLLNDIIKRGMITNCVHETQALQAIDVEAKPILKKA